MSAAYGPFIAIQRVRTMPTIWGCIEKIDDQHVQPPCIQIRTVLAGGIAIRTRPVVTRSTLIARGTERVTLSSLREGDFIEVTYHGGSGRLEADTIYARPDGILPVKEENEPTCR